MSKNQSCPACLALERGIRSRVAFKHTCGKEPAAVKKVKDEIVPLSFQEIKDSALDDPRLNMRQKLELLPINNLKELSEKLVKILNVEYDDLQDFLPNKESS